MKVRLFDVCVLGDGIGGLLAAIMLQKKGIKLVVLTDRRAKDFDPALCEFLNGFTIKPMLKRVGFHPTEVNAIPALEAPVQLAFMDHRLDCYGEEGRFHRELTREFPDHAKQILQLFKESYGHLEVYHYLFNSRVPLPPKGFFAHRNFRKMLDQVCDAQLLADRSLDKELKSFDVGDDFSRAVDAMQLALRDLITSWTSGAQLAHLLALVRWEGYDAAAGVATIRNMLLSKIKERGGLVAECDQIKGVMLEKKRIAGFELAGAEWSEVRCHVAMIGGDPRGLFAMAPDAEPVRQWQKKLSELQIFAGKAYQLYRVSPEGIPTGMQSQGLLIPRGRPNGGSERRRWVRALRYVVRKSENGDKSPHTWIGVSAFMDPSSQRPDLKRVSTEIREGLKSLIPFLENHLLEEPKEPYLPSMEGKPGDFRQGFIYTASEPRTLGVCGFTPETPLKNTFLAGDMIFPGLGLDGEVISGFQAAHYASEYLSADKRKLG
ncbi:MAG TPA: hypothetical protein VI895_10745 [Bdellovibrionota bacterium]|nr:hypothetical protein [Bdellovibrionota bacterium]